MDGLNIPYSSGLITSVCYRHAWSNDSAQHYIYLDVIGGNAQCSRIGFCCCWCSLGTT